MEPIGKTDWVYKLKYLNGVIKGRYYCIVMVLCLAATSVFVGAQDDQSGFISIDCGLADSSNYTDSTTGIFYTTDHAGFIESGVKTSISDTYRTNSIDRQFLNIRTFPVGDRNCYTLRPVQGKKNKYLIRASFMYGNYDEANQPPKFDLHLGVEYWDTVEVVDAYSVIRKEILHITESDHISVCLVKTGPSIPFISTLELRHLQNTMYSSKFGSLNLISRINYCPLSNQILRYIDDVYDRIWEPLSLPNTARINTKSSIDMSGTLSQLPPAVMSTACTPTNSDSLELSFGTFNSTDKIYIFMHFAELVKRKGNQTRIFNISLNGQKYYGPLSAEVLVATTIASKDPQTDYTYYQATINKTIDSTLPPIINAAEIYLLKEFSHPQTYEEDVVAVSNIKSTYELTKNWQGDPCAPQDFVWEGLDCISIGVKPMRIVSLKLASNRLQGNIAASIANLTMLRTLDLSNNDLSGNVPDFLAELDTLEVLKLEGNKFTGMLHCGLLEKSKSGKLSLSFDDPNNTNKEFCSPSYKKKKSYIPIIAISVAAVLFVLAFLFTIWLIRRRKSGVSIVESHNQQFTGKSNDSGEAISSNNFSFIKNQQFSYQEVSSITNNFQRVVGKGGFGIVYHGYIDATQVAVKMLSPTSRQGYREFENEARILMTIHHTNLTSLVGYCYEGTIMGIIYEYMPNGNLETHLLGNNPNVLTWDRRLQIAVDAAQGLEYLHHRCKPQIIHRDVKTTNILLDDNLEAKLADFGLSRVLSNEGGQNAISKVAGTRGYVAPECHLMNEFTAKSDVYSFGIVLLEIITGRPALSNNSGKVHIVPWVNSELEKGDVTDIVDPSLQGNYSVDSVQNFFELAMACVARDAGRRPTMNNVLLELKRMLGN